MTTFPYTEHLSLDLILHEIDRVLYGDEGIKCYNYLDEGKNETPIRYSLAVAFAELLTDSPKFITIRHLEILLKEFSAGEIITISRHVLDREGKSIELEHIFQMISFNYPRPSQVAI